MPAGRANNRDLERDRGFDLDLAFTLADGRSTLSRRLYAWPFSVGHAFALDANATACQVILQTASGGLIGRDWIRQRVTVGLGAHVEVCGQGALSVHGAHDARPGVQETTVLRVSRGAVLHYRPEIRIVFPRARLQQDTEAEVSPGGALVLEDAVVIHPSVTPNNFGEFVSRVTLRTGGAEADQPASSEEAQGFRSLPPLVETYRAFATVYLISPRCEQLTAEVVDAIASDVEAIDGVYASVTRLPGEMGIAVRMAAHNGEQLRRGLRVPSQMFARLAQEIVID